MNKLKKKSIDSSDLEIYKISKISNWSIDKIFGLSNSSVAVLISSFDEI